MSIFQTIIAARVIYILGIINIVSGLLVFFSCRCLPGLRMAHNCMQRKNYQRFYKCHCYFWWVFWISVIIHAVFGLAFLSWPF